MKKVRIFAENLRHNWYFPLGATAFYCTWFDRIEACPSGLMVAFLLCTAVAAMTDSLWNRIRNMDWWIWPLSALTAVGIFWDPQAVAYGGVSLAVKTEVLYGNVMAPYRLPYVLGELAMVAAWIFVFVCVAIFWEKLTKLFRETGVLKGIAQWEWIVYGAVLMISALFVTLAYAKTGVFSGQAVFDYDMIYTSDTAEIVKEGSYVSLFQAQNDIRQPLYAVFAAPFMGLTYLMGTLVYSHPSLQVLLLDLSQLALIFVGSFLISRMIELTPGKRVCFLLVMCCSYMYLLFILMMEQYAVAYFWLSLCIYLISCQKEEPMALWGAGGTLLTSLALLPLVPGKNPCKDFRDWFWGCVKQGCLFVAVMLLFCRLDVIWGLGDKVSDLGEFTGDGLTLWNKLLQYFVFVAACFAAPETIVGSTSWKGNPSWQLAAPEQLNWLGLGLFTLVLLSLWVNRKKTSSLLCGYWVAFSVAVLVILGWGTAENGLILYALYFGWAYYVLLFQLVEQVGEALGKRWLLPVIGVAAGGMLLLVNIPGMADMIHFAITYYPG